MKKMMAVLLALLLSLGCGSALAAGKLIVNQEAYVPLAWFDSFAGYVFAEIQNTGDKNVEFNSGVFEILDGEGEAVADGSLYAAYPNVLAPGETGYIFSYERAEDAESIEDIADYTLNIMGKSTSEEVSTRIAAKAEVVKRESRWGDEETYVVLTLTNEGAETVFGLEGAYGVYDAEGKLMYAGCITGYSVGLPAGQTLQMLDRIDEDFLSYWTEKGLAPAEVKAIAYQD